ncbi:hypothetical protein LZC95_32715 [Pendulispora brunnea]|uniref:Uncharacterized protein n=1 Tax=Pendulispora brunnea TaxID=2905690 RepID=A0ABZ2K1Z5_9BACT
MKAQTFFLGAVAAMAALASGCSDDDTKPSGSTPSAYERLGGHAGLLAFVKNEVENKVLKDSDLKTYFFNQVANPIPAGHPSAAQIEECFTRLVASVVQAEQYPGAPVRDAANTNTPDFTCRDMKSSHVGLNIGDKTFDKFVGVLAGDLMGLVVADGTMLTAGHISQSEYNVLAKALTDTKSSVTTPGAPAGPGPFVPPTPSAYERLGRHQGLLALVKTEVEQKILKDTNLKTYFFNQVANPIPAGHPSAAQIEECFTRLVGLVLQAEAYPGTAVNDPANTNTPNFTCRDMASAHTGLKIGDKTFDAFVTILATDLMPLVVADGTTPKNGQITQSEFNALAKALTDTKSEIVDPNAAPGPAPFPG